MNEQLAQAQQRTESAFGSARQAQEQASKQQEQAASAQQDLHEKQQAYQEAQAQAHTASQEARQAQQRAQQLAQQARQEAQQAQQEAQQAQRQQSETLAQQNQQARQQTEQLRQQSQQPVAVAPAPQAQEGTEQQIVGEVLSANDDELLLSSQGEPQLRLQLSPQTQVTVDGRQASAGDIQEGSQVRASYRTDAQSGEPQAVRIEATSQVQPTAPAAPESGQSTPGSQQPTQ
ncbi:hypothetical protein [Myxococcus sp. SDU36]|uniref:hypothetical protein n=1 Tax=Myxococcus sp. SDU36 TaxID=2831967 RepID=UPI002543F414|nr:hypothetical protein [Myxococcus sp. SDU36]